MLFSLCVCRFVNQARVCRFVNHARVCRFVNQARVCRLAVQTQTLGEYSLCPGALFGSPLLPRCSFPAAVTAGTAATERHRASPSVTEHSAACRGGTMPPRKRKSEFQFFRSERCYVLPPCLDVLQHTYLYIDYPPILEVRLRRGGCERTGGPPMHKGAAGATDAQGR